MAGSTPNIWAQMSYVPPRGRCNHKASLLSASCPCLRFMVHPMKVQSSFECDGCAHHASFHSMENAVDDATLNRWSNSTQHQGRTNSHLQNHISGDWQERSHLQLPDSIEYIEDANNPRKRRRALQALPLPSTEVEQDQTVVTLDEDSASTNASSVRGGARNGKRRGGAAPAPKRKAVPRRAVKRTAPATTGKVQEISEGGDMESVDQDGHGGEEVEAVPGAFGVPWSPIFGRRNKP